MAEVAVHPLLLLGGRGHGDSIDSHGEHLVRRNTGRTPPVELVQETTNAPLQTTSIQVTQQSHGLLLAMLIAHGSSLDTLKEEYCLTTHFSGHGNQIAEEDLHQESLVLEVTDGLEGNQHNVSVQGSKIIKRGSSLISNQLTGYSGYVH